MATRIQLRRDTASNWGIANPVLAAGEPGLETDTGFVKYGNGVTPWNSLPYASTGGGGGGAGSTGPQGVTGLQGIPGPQGPQGPQGPLGPAGPAGITGAAGSTGIQGLLGLQGATGIRGITGLGTAGPQGTTGLQGTQGVTGPAGTGGGGGVSQEYEIRLAAGTTVASMITGATRIPSGWLLDDGTRSLGNVIATGLGTVGASDLVIQTDASKYVLSIDVIQLADSGPASIQSYYTQHVSPTSLNFRTNTAGNQFVFYNFISITSSSRKTYLVVRMANIS
jgi:hypothetical protein